MTLLLLIFIKTLKVQSPRTCGKCSDMAVTLSDNSASSVGRPQTLHGAEALINIIKCSPRFFLLFLPCLQNGVDMFILRPCKQKIKASLFRFKAGLQYTGVKPELAVYAFAVGGKKGIIQKK